MRPAKSSLPAAPSGGIPATAAARRYAAPSGSVQTEEQTEDQTAPVEDIAALVCDKLAAYLSVWQAALAARLGLTLVEIKALLLIQELDGLPVGQLGQLLCLSSGGTTALLNRLEAAGFIRRRPHPLDRRAIVIQAVPEKCQELAHGRAALAEEVAFVSRQFDARQLQTVHAFLEQCARAFRHETLARLQSRHGPAQHGHS
ncbi:MarR family winged helix-turn-helix transcriptional regulator [Bordetella sp. 2513F-2]